jgi:tRNA U34 2-thiouridine synthase MnmA/TrmU
MFPKAPLFRAYLQKSEVRNLATKYNLPTQNRKDSQGICFLGKFKFNDFLQQHLGVMQGPIVQHETGQALGTHNGHWFFTIGQRQGIGLSGGPWYVVQKDARNNTVFISNRYEQVEKERMHFTVRDLGWIAQRPTHRKLLVKIRHRSKPSPCTLTINGTGGNVQLERKDQGIAAGQHAVFYDGKTCLGSGIIE